MKLYLFIPICTAIVFSACISGTGSASDADSSSRLEAVLTDYQEGYYKFWPLSASAGGDHRYDDQMSNFLTREFETTYKAFNSNILARLDSIDRESLNATEKVSYDVLVWRCRHTNESIDLKDELMPLNQIFSRHLWVAQIAGGKSIHPFETVEDYDNWLSRLNHFLAWTDTAMVYMRTGMETGYILPKSLIEKMIPQLDNFITMPAEDNLFYTPAKNFPEGISDEEKDRLRTAYADIISVGIVPKYTELKTFLEEEYLPAGRKSSGISHIPGGEDMYDYYIRYYTTTDRTADEIFELGKSEVARIRGEMEAVMEEVGFEGSLREFFDHVREKPELMPYTEPQQVLDNFERIHETMKPQLTDLFDKVPETPFEIRRTEAFREASASAHYNQGNLEEGRPGIFYVPIPDVRKYNVFRDEDLFLHEAIPGHHYQIALQQENDALPEFRKDLWMSAYGEGWALYTESLGKDLGLYTDPYQYFGMLSAEMHRAIRLVVDVGIHVKGWTREEAIEYSLDNEAEPVHEVISEVERYMAAPGQALSYKIGQLKILELRARAEAELGDDFDIREFHNKVLEPGCVPLAVLEAIIDNWIAERKAAAA